MLDSKAIKVKQRGGILHRKRIIVLGAVCTFGRSMVRALDACGAQVVAADTNAEALAMMSGAVALPLKACDAGDLRRVGRAWGEARLDAVLNLIPLRHPNKIDTNIAVLQGIVQGFMPALSTHDGQIVSVVTRPEQPLDVAAGAMAPALASAQAALADALRHDGLTINSVTLGSGAAAPAQQAVVGLLAKTLGPLTGTDLRV